MSYRHPIAPELNPQKVSISGVSASSVAFGSTTKAVRLVSDTDCWITIGDSPTATLTSTYLPAKFPQVFGCNPGQKVAVIGTSGNLYVSEAVAAY